MSYYEELVNKNKRVNPEALKRLKSHKRIEKWLDEEEVKHANDTEPDFRA
jgi:hypothetical protein